MAVRRQVSLTVIGPPALGPVVSAPPVLNASDHTIEYVCGHCQTALLHAEEDEIRNLQIQCTRCGRYNRTEV